MQENAEDLTNQLDKCGQEFRIHCTCCGHVKTVETRCDRKWCPVCQHRLATRTSLRYEGISASCQWPLFVTFTVKNHDDVSLDFVRAIRKAFDKLRRLRWWKRCVVGGVASLEVTNKGRGWHPHVHALIDCQWLSVLTPQPRRTASGAQWRAAGRLAAQEVGEQWQLCCDRPASVKVRRVWGKDQGDSKPITTEVLKYSVKGSDLVKCQDNVAPVIRMLQGTRLVTSWGTMHGHPANKRPKAIGSQCPRCEAVGEWMPEEVLNRLTKAPRNYLK